MGYGCRSGWAAGTGQRAGGEFGAAVRVLVRGSVSDAGRLVVKSPMLSGVCAEVSLGNDLKGWTIN